MYKCLECGSEDTFVYGLANISPTAGPKRSSITYCENCCKYYYNESSSIKLGGKLIRRFEITNNEAVELIVKMKSCLDPQDINCKCNTHKFVNTFAANHENVLIYE